MALLAAVKHVLQQADDDLKAMVAMHKILEEYRAL